MREYTQTKASPEYEQTVIEIYASFGWELVTAQEFYSESTETTGVDVTSYGDGIVGSFMRGFTGRDGTIKVNQRTNVTNFVSLRFSRETNIPYYDELVEREREYFKLLDVQEPKKPVKRTVILAIGVVILLVSIILAFIESNVPKIWELIVTAVFLAVMVPLTVVGWVKYKQRIRYYDYSLSRMSQLISEAREIVDSL